MLALPSLASFAATPMVWMRQEVNWLAHLPGANVPMAVPPIWQIILYYLVLSLPLLPWTWPSIKRWIRCAPVAAALLAMLPMLIAAAPSPGGGETRITLLSIGAGQIGIVELPEQADLRLTTNIVNCAHEDLVIGMPMRVTFEIHADGEDVIAIPLFEPDRTSA